MATYFCAKIATHPIMTTSEKYSPTMQLALLLLFIGLGIIAGSACTLLFANLYLRATPNDFAAVIAASKDPLVYRVLQIINVIFVMILPAIFFARTNQSDAPGFLRFTKAISGKQAFLLVFIVLAALMIGGSLGAINEMIPIPESWANYFKELEDEYNNQVLVITSMKHVQDYIAGIFILALLPAIAEEMIFRACIQKVFISISKNAWTGIIITATLFSMMHLSFYGFLPRLFLGILLGYVFYKGDNIWLTIIIHFLNNAFALTQMYAVSLHGEAPSAALEENLPMIYGAVGAVLFVLLFRIFNRETEFVLSMYRTQKLSSTNSTSDDTKYH